MSEPYEECLTIAMTELRTALSLLTAEIGAYPTPISGCDAQFTRLLSDRTRITEAIRVMNSMPFVPTPRVMYPGARVESR